MTSKKALINEIETLPPHFIGEVYNYISFLKSNKVRNDGTDEISLASENVLARDWLLPEEDIAWAD